MRIVGVQVCWVRVRPVELPPARLSRTSVLALTSRSHRGLLISRLHSVPLLHLQADWHRRIRPSSSVHLYGAARGRHGADPSNSVHGRRCNSGLHARCGQPLPGSTEEPEWVCAQDDLLHLAFLHKLLDGSSCPASVRLSQLKSYAHRSPTGSSRATRLRTTRWCAPMLGLLLRTLTHDQSDARRNA